jgi:hypothetical protein
MIFQTSKTKTTLRKPTNHLAMPLKYCASQNCFERNIASEVRSGKPVKQAVAIAYSVKRKAQAKARKK